MMLTLQVAESGRSGSKLLAPHAVQRSGSHSLTAMKQGHCLVEQWALHLHPGYRFLQPELKYITRKVNILYIKTCTNPEKFIISS